MIRLGLALAGICLTGFHAWLFGHQLWNGHLDYAEALRWFVAAGLSGGLVALRRQGTSLLWNRKATAIWVLAAFLHGPALTHDSTRTLEALSQAPDAVVQLVGAVLGVGLAVALARRARVWSTPLAASALAGAEPTLVVSFRTPLDIRGRARPPSRF